ncbi:MAG: hypothetical protein QXW67_03700 [Candidatus Micrarchaeia archaeon]
MNEGTWRDEYGTTAIRIGRNLISTLLQKWKKSLAKLCWGLITCP